MDDRAGQGVTAPSSSSVLPSVVRTVVPAVVALLLGWAARVGFDLPTGTVTLIVTAVILGAYYWLVRLIERRWPAVGRLLLALGLTDKQPTYTRPPAPVGDEQLLE